MGRGFARAFSAAEAVFARADAALGFGLSSLVESGPAEALALTENTQPAVLTASIAALQAARAAGLPQADFVAGHSLGEYGALVAAGVLSFEDAVRIVRERGRLMQQAVPAGVGAMAAILQLASSEVAAACAEVEQASGRVVGLANLNGPDQTVIAGHADAVAQTVEACKSRGARRAVMLDVSAPFHCQLMQPVQPGLAAVLAPVSWNDAAIPVVSNVEATPETRAARLSSLLVEQVTAPVRWTEVLRRLADEGCDTFFELGPGTVLAGLVKRQLPGVRVFSIPTPEKLDAALAAWAS